MIGSFCFPEEWKRLKILKIYLVNTANRNGQTDGVHCVSVTDGIVGQNVFH